MKVVGLITKLTRARNKLFLYTTPKTTTGDFQQLHMSNETISKTSFFVVVRVKYFKARRWTFFGLGKNPETHLNKDSSRSSQ
jgi:hypothetical protein